MKYQYDYAPNSTEELARWETIIGHQIPRPMSQTLANQLYD